MAVAHRYMEVDEFLSFLRSMVRRMSVLETHPRQSWTNKMAATSGPLHGGICAPGNPGVPSIVPLSKSLVFIVFPCTEAARG